MSRLIISLEQRIQAHKMRSEGKTWQCIESVMGIIWDSLKRSIRQKGLETYDRKDRPSQRRFIALPAELRFHVMRLGTRKNVSELYGCGYLSIYQALPIQDVDLYQRGQMVRIGNVLAKKCFTCGTARELEHFLANPSAKSGCRETCQFCRIKQKTEELEALLSA